MGQKASRSVDEVDSYGVTLTNNSINASCCMPFRESNIIKPNIRENIKLTVATSTTTINNTANVDYVQSERSANRSSAPSSA